MSTIPHINLSQLKSIVIAGANQGIGYAFIEEILKLNPKVKIYATYRNEQRTKSLLKLKKNNPNQIEIIRLDANKYSDYSILKGKVLQQTPSLCGIINCIGFLHDEKTMPEKRLEDIDPQQVLKSFGQNSMPTLLLAQQLKPLLKHKAPSFFVSLSARVGSITDNRGGGWYSYRASKAALNMFIKNIDLEYRRYGCNTLTLSLHPGTTRTQLSEPFIENTKYHLHSANETAQNLLKVIKSKSIENSGEFFDWKGETIPW